MLLIPGIPYHMCTTYRQIIPDKTNAILLFNICIKFLYSYYKHKFNFIFIFATNLPELVNIYYEL